MSGPMKQLENDPWKEQIKLASRRLQRLQETEANYASDDCSSLASSYYSPSEDSTSDDSSESSEAESGGSTSRSPGPETGRGTRKGGRALGRRQASKKRHARRDPLAFQLQGGGQETVLPDAGGTAEGAGSRTTDHPVKRSRQLSLTGQVCPSMGWDGIRQVVGSAPLPVSNLPLCRMGPL